MEQAYELKFSEDRNSALYVTCCGCSKTEPLHSFGPAIKPHYLIHYVMDGKGVFTIDGQEYPLRAGYGFLIEPDEMTFYQADEAEPWTYVWAGFSGAQAPGIVQSMGLNKKYPVFWSDKGDELYQCVRDMMEHSTYSVENELRRNGELSIFLSLIAGNVSVQESHDGNKANTYVERAIEFVYNNYYNPIRVTDMADYVCVNRSYLYTLFRSQIGMSPQQFLTMFRVAKAAQLLQITDLSIESVAISCGYSDPMVFSKIFRQTRGMAPSVYRRQVKQGGVKNSKDDLQKIEEFLRQVRQP